jgi:uncharacterized protein YbaA (DUF1428 family)
MTRYIDTVVIPVATENLDAYRELATEAGQVWIDHGALAYFEGVTEPASADEETTPMRTIRDLLDLDDESAVFAFITFESRAHRDEVTAAVMADPAYQAHFGEEMPFDPSRMVTARFRSIVDYESTASVD